MAAVYGGLQERATRTCRRKTAAFGAAVLQITRKRKRHAAFGLIARVCGVSLFWESNVDGER
ncbi:hypothetical protein HYPDE_28963 [Hyphomicrobium denitrificans 1NES1]|uniref:Uncharacterized protein n=1 Tax=Hyphomicrobium denitrificans 1NES1 TaxID=670307 RepID=N0BAB5_9HYPH|nr:hypothetical protein HYPDE_28963 [Hyphomicrobium denitrificans 1NES1]